MNARIPLHSYLEIPSHLETPSYLIERLLTPRQLEIFTFFGELKRIDEIAELMGISTKTAYIHKWNIIDKLEFKGPDEFLFNSIWWLYHKTNGNGKTKGGNHMKILALPQEKHNLKWLNNIIDKLAEEKFFGSITIKFENGVVTIAEEVRKHKPPVQAAKKGKMA